VHLVDRSSGETTLGPVAVKVSKRGEGSEKSTATTTQAHEIAHWTYHVATATRRTAGSRGSSTYIASVGPLECPSTAITNMHPGDERHHGHWGDREYRSNEAERKNDASPPSSMGCSHITQHHTLLRLPTTVTSIYHDTRREDSIQHRSSPAPTVFSSQGYSYENQRYEHPNYPTVFSANPFGRDRRQRFPHSHDSNVAESSPRRAFGAQEYRSPVTNTGKASLAFILVSNEGVEEKEESAVAESSSPPTRLNESSPREEEEDDSSDDSQGSLLHGWEMRCLFYSLC
jgi:hypothetical protein